MATPLVWAMDYPTADVVFTAIAAVAVIVLHRGNIVRLLGGNENRIALRRSAPRREPPAPV